MSAIQTNFIIPEDGDNLQISSVLGPPLTENFTVTWVTNTGQSWQSTAKAYRLGDLISITVSNSQNPDCLVDDTITSYTCAVGTVPADFVPLKNITVPIQAGNLTNPQSKAMLTLRSTGDMIVFLNNGSTWGDVCYFDAKITFVYL